jgi:murein DD-endopeptidase MepM/ murein hydrolase activator NlpD
MNPTLEVVNGKTAKVSQTQEVPRQQITQERPDWQYITTRTEYVNVVDSLEITPHVFADDYIGLETKILLGSKLTPEGVKQLPIITMKEIENKENRIRQGESLVIGGIRKTEKRDVSRGVPFLKDIPVLGILFSGRDFEERAVETIFILTPTISTGGRPTEEVIEEINRKHEGSETGTSHDALTDPFGLKARRKEQQRKADEAEQARLKVQAEKAEARHTVREAEAQAERAENQAQLATAEVARLKAEAEQTREDAEKLTTDAKLAKEKAAATEKQAQTEIEKAKAEAQAAQAEIQRLKAELKKAEEKAAAEADRNKDPPKPEQRAETPAAETGKAKKPTQKSQQG